MEVRATQYHQDRTRRTGKFKKINQYRGEFGENSIKRNSKDGIDTLANTLETDNIHI